MVLVSLKNVVASIFFFLALCIFSLVYAEEISFSQDLRLGDRGESVLKLQKALNTRLETQVAMAGAGSLGNETTFFGPRTLQAVIIFQNLYKGEVLEPVGLAYGTGFVGSQTRKKLNMLFHSGSSGVQVNTPPFSTAPPFIENQVMTPPPVSLVQSTSSLSDLVSLVSKDESVGPDSELVFFYPTNYSGEVGSSVTFQGSGFALQGNTVFFGDKTFEGIVSATGKEIVFTVPPFSAGRYEVAIANRGKKSNSHYFHVITPSAGAPVIQKITPLTARNGDIITIRGEGFTPDANIVYTGFGVIENLRSSDTKTIFLTLDSPYESGGETSGSVVPLWFYVENNNGFSNGSILNLTL